MGDPLYEKYHDEEWGRPLFNEQKMFEFLILETFQAGLSWITILKKREHLRTAFHQFNPQLMSQMTEADVVQLLRNPNIIRHRGKIQAAIHNARRVLELQSEGQSLVDLFWRYVQYRPIQNEHSSIGELPASTPLSKTIAADLKKMGFKFIGPTVIYAHMQATGMVNDHLITCPAYEPCQQAAQQL